MDNSSGGLGSNLPIVLLCLCGTEKDSMEDLEIHIKVEHLKWLPYACAHCKAQRPTGLQMHEHLVVQHPKEAHNFCYNKNAENERLLAQYKRQAIEMLVRSYAALNGMDIDAFLKKTANASRCHAVNEVSSSTAVMPNCSSTPLAPPIDATSVESHSSIEIDPNEDYGLLNDIIRMRPVRPDMGEQAEVLHQLAALTGTSTPQQNTTAELPSTVSTARAKQARSQLYCTLCFATFNRQQMKLTHALFHYLQDNNVVRFRCNSAQCDYQSKDKSGINHHVKKNHGGDPVFISDLKATAAEEILNLYGHYIIPHELVNNSENLGTENHDNENKPGFGGEQEAFNERAPVLEAIQDSPTAAVVAAMRKRALSPCSPAKSPQIKHVKFG